MNAILNVYRRSPFWATFVLIMLKMVLFRQFNFGTVQIDRLLADAAAVLVILCIAELLTTSRWKPLVFGAVNGLLAFILFACTVYFSFFGSIPTYTALSGLDQVGQVGDSVKSAINPKFYLLFLDLVVMIALALIGMPGRASKHGSSGAGKPLYVGIALVVALGASVLYIRSDLHISNELVQAQRLGVLNYQVATAINERKENQAIKDGDPNKTAEALAELVGGHFGGEATEAGTPKLFGAAKGKNVIVIQLESFQDIMVGLTVNGQEVTPVLNDLISDEGSFYFNNVFQQIGQGNTSDAEWNVNTGIYPTGTEAMSKGYGDRAVPALPRLLASEGYVSNTFHVNDVTFWDRNQMYPALGFTKYYDKPAFNNDNFNALGASDEEMYRVGFDVLKQHHEKGQPFYAQFITTSSHNPFWVPAKFKHIEIPASLEKKQLGYYIEATNYTDYALGLLIENLKQSGMWDDTMLVVYGDHFGLQTKENPTEFVEEELGIKYDDRIGRFNIPFFVHVPGVQGETSDQVGGQVDIMPTIANLLGLDLKEKGATVFGKDLINTTRNVIGMRYYLPTGSFFNDDILFVPGEGFDDGKAYDIETMEPVADFSQYRQDYDYILNLMKLSDEYVKLLPKR
ncbi:LTA synthase family protein [Paenibacillus sp. PAMC21692]|uniref:LTA synthase family protein n=1 Tax=Paenibacillus sp. PAMC21692 TaxID=2762320 RepID=UPI00164DD476|nr:LTA synthase family protein [Paenibacillus sp. PAMC21692]QNK56734.1 LTA synthase family protein [Paenibacillus sp. PAMC21692]